MRAPFGRLKIDAENLKKEGAFRLLDSFTVTTGLHLPRNTEFPVNRSVSLQDWGDETVKAFKDGHVESQAKKPNVLHIDDNTSVLHQYNDEKTFVDWVRTRSLPEGRAVGRVVIHSAVAGVAAPALYKQLEALLDGIIDFKS